MIAAIILVIIVAVFVATECGRDCDCSFANPPDDPRLRGVETPLEGIVPA